MRDFPISELIDSMTSLVGGDQPALPLRLYQVAVRAGLIYILGIAIIRLGKSRLVSHTTPLDFILGVMLGSLLSRGINGSASLSSTLCASMALIAFHWFATWISYKSHVIGNLIKGHSRVLVEDGKIHLENMRRSHISEHDLLEELRLNANTDNIGDVKTAYKERSGEIGVTLRKKPVRVLEIHVHDGVQTVRIEL